MQTFVPLPAPYLCSDRGSFAEKTLLVRLPEIARRVIEENRFSDEINHRIEGLIAEIPDTPVRRIVDPGAPDAPDWDAYIDRWQAKTWHELSFFACEMIFYRRILEATGYFQRGDTYQLDPFRQQKDLGYTSSIAAAKNLIDRLEEWIGPGFRPEQALKEAIEANLWGNRADLSLWPADGNSESTNQQLHQPEEFLLANQLNEAVSGLLAANPESGLIHFVVDNAGFELINDLVLADLLLSCHLAHGVIFHVKGHPTFVSDAIEWDVHETIGRLSAESHLALSKFGRRLKNYAATDSLRVIGHFYWNSPNPFWALPASLFESISSAKLVVVKGDANYRRLTGDLRWETTTPFAKVTEYFPVPLLSLRVAKSEVMVGLQAGQAERLDLLEKDWRTNGRWGQIQYRNEKAR